MRWTSLVPSPISKIYEGTITQRWDDGGRDEQE
jgi:hypothetical protein